MSLDSAVLLGAVVEWALPAVLSALAGWLLGRASALRARRKAEAARDDALADGVTMGWPCIRDRDKCTANCFAKQANRVTCILGSARVARIGRMHKCKRGRMPKSDQ